MKQKFISAGLMLWFFSACLRGSANTVDTRPVAVINCKRLALEVSITTDTIPSPVKASTAGATQPAGAATGTVIKVVPKARKVPVPRQVKTIKPVKVNISKPKIIKPVIRILN
jgi:hypothetical protein